MSDDRFSISDIMEMAMGLSMVQQTNKIINQTLDNIPRNTTDPFAAMNNTQMDSAPRYLYAMVNGQQVGPMTLGEVTFYLNNGSINLDTYMWKPGLLAWQLARDIDDIKYNATIMKGQPPMVP